MAYMTEQRKLLYEFFQSHPHDKFCVKDIYAALSQYDISRSAIYRNLSAMKKDGLVRCDISEGSRDVFYQFVNSTHCSNAIHLSCVECGKTFHMKNSYASQLQNELAQQEGFSINKSKTVLYGTCKNCKNG